MKIDSLWSPQSGPQTYFLKSSAYEVLFGGAKGGGKSEVLLFAALRFADNPAYKALILRRTFPKLLELIERSKRFSQLGAIYNIQGKMWRFPSGALIRFGHCENPGDEINYQGQEYQYIGFDQLEEFTETMYNIIKAQGRSSAGIPVFIRSTANPGGIGSLFIKQRFIEGKEPNKKYYRAFTAVSPNDKSDKQEIVLSSIFIPSTIYDNKILLKNDPSYIAKLMDLPEKYRKMYLDGDWNVDSSPDQLIQYDWLKPHAFAAPINLHALKNELESSFLGVDVARYGNDSTVFCFIRNNVLTKIEEHKKIDLVATTNLIREIIEERRVITENISIDTDGIGAGVYDNLKSYGYNVNAVIGGSRPLAVAANSYQFANLRSQLYWNLREQIRNEQLKLPDDPALFSELTAIKYKISQDRMIQIESKEEIKKRIGKSPDLADSLCYALSAPLFKEVNKVSVTII